MIDFYTIVSIALGGVSFCLVAFCFVSIAKLKQQNSALLKKLLACESQNQQLELAIDEVRNNSLGMGQVIEASKASFQHQVQELIDKQNELSLFDPESKHYSRAAKMVAKGATVEDIMQECEIPRAEAELVLAMRGGRS